MASPSDLGRLRIEWYQRLKAEGFVDIEPLRRDGQDSDYLQLSPMSARLEDVEDHGEDTSDYYSLAVEYLHHGRFRGALHRRIWGMHSEGVPMREIASQLGQTLKLVWQSVQDTRSAIKLWQRTRPSTVIHLAPRRDVDPSTVLDDAQWKAIEPLLTRRKVGSRGRPPRNLRGVVTALVWLLRTGMPWRALPPSLPRWTSVHTAWRRWVQSGIWQAIAKQIDDFDDTLICRSKWRFGMPLGV